MLLILNGKVKTDLLSTVGAKTKKFTKTKKSGKGAELLSTLLIGKKGGKKNNYESKSHKASKKRANNRRRKSHKR